MCDGASTTDSRTAYDPGATGIASSSSKTALGLVPSVALQRSHDGGSVRRRGGGGNRCNLADEPTVQRVQARAPAVERLHRRLPAEKVVSERRIEEALGVEGVQRHRAEPTPSRRLDVDRSNPGACLPRHRGGSLCEAGHLMLDRVCPRNGSCACCLAP